MKVKWIQYGLFLTGVFTLLARGETSVKPAEIHEHGGFSAFSRPTYSNLKEKDDSKVIEQLQAQLRQNHTSRLEVLKWQYENLSGRLDRELDWAVSQGNIYKYPIAMHVHDWLAKKIEKTYSPDFLAYYLFRKLELSLEPPRSIPLDLHAAKLVAYLGTREAGPYTLITADGYIMKIDMSAINAKLSVPYQYSNSPYYDFEAIPAFLGKHYAAYQAYRKKWGLPQLSSP